MNGSIFQTVEDGFDDSEWKTACPVDGSQWGPLRPRMLPRLRETAVVPERIVERDGTTIDAPFVDALPIALAVGDRLVLDIGRTVQAYSIVELDADDGAVLQIQYAQRYCETDREPWTSRIGDPNRYTTRAGRQTCMSTDTFGCRYLVLEAATGRLTVHRVTMVDRVYPYDRIGRFVCSDPALTAYWDCAVRTVEVCSEDAYVDCADRERSEWMADGYLAAWPVARAALAGAGRFEDPRLLASMVRHVAWTQLPDGRLRPAPLSSYPLERKHGVIDDYACLWTQALRETVERTGDLNLARELWPVLQRVVAYYLSRRTPRGLVHAVDFVYTEGNPLRYVACEGATFNAFFYRALRDAAALAALLGDDARGNAWRRAAVDLREAYNRHLWDSEAQTYSGGILSGDDAPEPDTPPTYAEPYTGACGPDGRTPATAHAALLALFYELVPVERHPLVLRFLLERFEAEQPPPYTYRFYLDLLFRQDRADHDRRALAIIRERFAPMAAREAGTTCEHWRGASWIHEAGAHPAYHLSTFVLGVRAHATDGELGLLIEPRLGDLSEAEGTVASAWGPVSVAWHRSAGRLDFRLQLPVGATVRLPIPHGTEQSALSLNDRAVAADTADRRGRYLERHLPPGTHTGSLTG